MRSRPIAIHVFSAILLLSGPLWLASLSVFSKGDFTKAIGQINLYWFSLFACGAVLGLGLWRLKRWAWIGTLSYVIVALFLLHKNVFENENLPYGTVLIGTAAAVGAVICLLDSRILGLYFGTYREWLQRSPRFEVQSDAEIDFLGQADSAVVLNVSETGCLIQVQSTKLPEGSKITVRTGETLGRAVLRAKVVRSSPVGYGMVFVPRTTEEKTEIKRMMDSFQPRFSTPPKMAS